MPKIKTKTKAKGKTSPTKPARAKIRLDLPSATGHFGVYGGCFAPETLMPAAAELTRAYLELRKDASFQRSLRKDLERFAGRPTPISFAANLTAQGKGARIYLKREDLLHTGSHKLNNALGQIMVARRMGKTRIIAETGAGQHGVAVATVCAHFGMKAVVYMGEEDIRRQSLNVCLLYTSP